MAYNPSAEYLHINIAMSVLATVGVALRLYARWIIRVRPGLDDFFIWIAWVVLVGLNITGGICMWLQSFKQSLTSISLSTFWSRWNTHQRYFPK
jgi:hypothetical protein